MTREENLHQAPPVTSHHGTPALRALSDAAIRPGGAMRLHSSDLPRNAPRRACAERKVRQPKVSLVSSRRLSCSQAATTIYYSRDPDVAAIRTQSGHGHLVAEPCRCCRMSTWKSRAACRVILLFSCETLAVERGTCNLAWGRFAHYESPVPFVLGSKTYASAGGRAVAAQCIGRAVRSSQRWDFVCCFR
jgi:hypothetical protein